MQKYQLTVLVNEKVQEVDRNEIFESIKKHFDNLIKEDLWGVRSLSYDIKHMSKAFYAYFEFEAEPAGVITLDKYLRLNEDIIRYLIVKAKVKRQNAKVKKEKSEEKTDIEKKTAKRLLRQKKI